VVGKLLERQERPAFLKIDVQYAREDELFARQFGIPARKVYSGELCPDHCSVMVLADALHWAENMGSTILLVETAGLCLRCAPYVDGGMGMIVLEATSGMNLPLKIGPMLTLADKAVVTKTDLVSQAEKEVFRAKILETAGHVRVHEVNALYGIGVDVLVEDICALPPVHAGMELRGNPPVGTCTVCVGKKSIGWENHFGVVRPLNQDLFFRGE